MSKFEYKGPDGSLIDKENYEKWAATYNPLFAANESKKAGSVFISYQPDEYDHETEEYTEEVNDVHPTDMTKEEFFDFEKNQAKSKEMIEKYGTYEDKDNYSEKGRVTEYSYQLGYHSRNELTLDDEKIEPQQYADKEVLDLVRGDIVVDEFGDEFSTDGGGRQKRDYELYTDHAKEMPVCGNALYLSNAKEIGEDAFAGQCGITSVFIEDSDGIKIGKGAFSECDRLRNVRLPEQLEEIPESMFENDINIERLKLPQETRKVGNRAFAGCEMLNYIHVPYGVKEIGDSAFSACGGLIDVSFTYNNSIEKIGSYAFFGAGGERGNQRLWFEFPDTLREIGEGAFKDAYIGYISMGKETIKSIDIDKAFMGSGIDTEKLKEAAKEIENMDPVLMPGVENLVTVTITNEGKPWEKEKEVEKIKVRPEIRSFKKFKEAVAAIDINNPEECKKLEDTMKMLYSGKDFENCARPEVIEEMYNVPADKIKRAMLKSDNVYNLRDNIAWAAADQINLDNMCRYMGIDKADIPEIKDENYVDIKIPEGTKEIHAGDYAGINMKSIKIPDSVEWIEAGAFAGCTNLEEVEISDKTLECIAKRMTAEGKTSAWIDVETCGTSAASATELSVIDEMFVGTEFFAYNLSCSLSAEINKIMKKTLTISNDEDMKKNFKKLVEEQGKDIDEICYVKIAEGVRFVESIPSYVNIESVEIPKSAVLIGKEWADRFIKDGGKITIDKDNPIYKVNDAKVAVKSDTAVIYVSPDELMQSSSVWNSPEDPDVHNVIVIDKDVDLSNHDNIKDVTVISNRCRPEVSFENCGHLESFTVDESVIIKDRAFKNCTALKNVLMDNTDIPYMGKEAFKDCTALENVSMKNASIEVMEGSVFKNCRSIESIDIPGTKNIGNAAFANCTKLKTAVIGSGCEEIDDKAFMNCENLEKAVLPETLREIYPAAFSDCRRLKNIILPDKLNTLGSKAFKNCSGLTTMNTPMEGKHYIDVYSYETRKGAYVSSDAFTGCENLTDITGASIERLAWLNGRIEGAEKLREGIQKRIDDYVKETGETFVFDNEKRETVINYIGKEKEVIIPESVKDIDEKTFKFSSNKENIESVIIPDSVKYLWGGTFTDCKNLKKISISDNLLANTNIKLTFSGTKLNLDAMEKRHKEILVEEMNRRQEKINRAKKTEAEESVSV